jgi:hypothetical protein
MNQVLIIVIGLAAFITVTRLLAQESAKKKDLTDVREHMTEEDGPANCDIDKPEELGQVVKIGIGCSWFILTCGIILIALIICYVLIVTVF